MILKDTELSSQLTGFNKGVSSQRKKLIIISSIVFGVIIITLIIIIIATSFSNSKKESESGGGGEEDQHEDVKVKLGEINCLYDVKSISKDTILLSNEFKKDSNFDIEIDEQIIKYSKNYRFEKTGPNNVKFILYEPLVMDFMFKDVPDLVSIEMKSDKNLEIRSMISVFEDCQSLYEIIITGFDTSKVTSMKKLFYRTSIDKIDISDLSTKSVTDMSFMFASTDITRLDTSTMDTSKVVTMANMFQFCGSLETLDLSNFNTENVKDMSNMFFFLFIII